MKDSKEITTARGYENYYAGIEDMNRYVFAESFADHITQQLREEIESIKMAYDVILMEKESRIQELEEGIRSVIKSSDPLESIDHIVGEDAKKILQSLLTKDTKNK